MECLTAKETIDRTLEIVKDTSYSEKKSSIPTQEDIDNLLDNILLLQNKLNDSSSNIEYINDRLDELTWLNNIDEDSLKQINNVIGSARYLHSILIKQYVSLSGLRKRGVAKEATKRFKSSIDNLRESINDIDSIFFALPQIPGFIETTKELCLA